MPDFEDDASILGTERLLRRIPNWPNMYKFDDNLKAWRLTSANFSDPELSVDFRELIEADGNDVSYSIQGKEGFGLAQFTVIQARSLQPKQAIVRNPIVNQNPYHGLVAGKKTGAVKNSLAKVATLLIEPNKPD